MYLVIKMLTMTEPDITQKSADVNQNPADNGLHVNQKPLKHNHSLFVQAYMLTNNAAEAVRRIGYKGKNDRIMGYKLLNNPRIRAEIDRLQGKQAEIVAQAVEAKLDNQLKSITKDTFVDKALKDYESVDVDSANRPRYLDLAARGAGIIGKDGATITNNTLIVNVDAKSIDPALRWDKLRALIEGS